MAPPTSAPSLAQTPSAPAIPKGFLEYLKSFGPGLITVLTWLGAGDIVAAAVSGGNYGYALMWAMVLAIMARYMFVSMIARYQLCNFRGEGVVDGLARLHRWYAPFLFISVLFWGHLANSYMLAGLAQISYGVTGFASKRIWEYIWVAICLSLIFKPVYARAENLIKILIGLLGISLLGCAIWVGIDIKAVFRGVFGFQVPPQQGPYSAVLCAVGMIGAVGGSLVNLVYPYFIEQKGWKGPAYRKLQNYDFLLAVVVMIVFNLAVWTLGAELVYGTGKKVASIDDMAGLLGAVLGQSGRLLFLLGVFAAIFKSVVGSSLGLGYLASHSWLRWQAGNSEPLTTDYRSHRVYKWVIVWILVSPLVWNGKADFVSLTILANSFSVVMIPALAGGLWWITASPKFIGPQYRNRWWDNAVMSLIFIIAFYSAFVAFRAILNQIGL